MTENAIVAKKPVVEGKFYLQAGSGVFNKQHSDRLAPLLGIGLGGGVEINGKTKLNTELGFGITTNGNLKVSHEFDIAKNMGLEISGNAAFAVSNSASSVMTRANVEQGDKRVKSIMQTNWSDGYGKVGLGTAVNFKNDKGNIKVGLEAGYTGNTAPNINHDHNSVIQQTIPEASEVEPYKCDYNNQTFYITPTISGEYVLPRGFSVVGDLSLLEAKVGVRYNIK